MASEIDLSRLFWFILLILKFFFFLKLILFKPISFSDLEKHIPSSLSLVSIRACCPCFPSIMDLLSFFYGISISLTWHMSTSFDGVKSVGLGLLYLFVALLSFKILIL